MKSLLLFILFQLCASVGFSQNHTVFRGTIGAGGEVSRNTNFVLNATLGQAIAANISNTTIQNELGFWYGQKNFATVVDKLKTSLPGADLKQNYPNPFRKFTIIEFEINSPAFKDKTNPNVRIDIYNIVGLKVKTILEKPLLPGKYSLRFDKTNLEPGAFFYCLTYGDKRITKKMTLIN